MPAKVTKTKKEKTRGQKQIHQENGQTVLYYSLASLISALLVVAISMMTSSSSGQWVCCTMQCWVLMVTTLTLDFQVGWVVATILQAIAIGTMCKMAKDIRNSKRHLVDAGTDLNDPHGFGE